MAISETNALTIDPTLQVRLSALAEREGFSIAEMAEKILRAHLDDAERHIVIDEEDERRWQKYLETGVSVPFETVRSKVQRLAANAAAQAESK
ncbi:MAG: hypothetical protein MRY59_07910 [Aquisalinus sp.]|nr:hypothetical protein [Aquisalinus sp.]